MLIELSVRDLGVIADLQLVIGPGMTVLTGETGAGKTLVVDAIELLVGGRADPVLVRPGADEARVDGRFVVPEPADGSADEDGGPRPGDEIVLSRVVPRSGRSRAYVDGRPATVAELARWGRRLVDLHGQHAHQSLLGAAVQRATLDRFGGVDLGPLHAARARVAELDAALAALGGDERARARETDLHRFQVEELDAAAITGPDEDDELAAEEDVLADAVAHREAGAAAVEALTGDGGAGDPLGVAVAALADRSPYRELEQRLRAVVAEVTDVAAEVRGVAEAIDPDPDRLAQIRERRQLLRDLRRKYGETLEDVIAYHREAAERLAELESHDARAAELDAERRTALAELAAVEAEVGTLRRTAAPDLARAIEERLADLEMARARVVVAVGDDDPGDDVELRLAANPGSDPQALAKVASGGELARAMLAIRLVLTSGPPTLVFDEVDAGIGGEAAVAVGRALADLAPGHQVLVVTHLPQVAACADHQVSVAKREVDGTTVSEARLLTSDERVLELSRMLSGNTGSEAAREHAAELLASAERSRR
ncbi:DNA repair protein RecN [Actinomarinicola tropica]|uniref:DNA repair protein RecN n=1 Tax=Actinomarinicola tropica TaxID=2789776 RepID=A0A5Q2RJX6_9ACTN|nr:DNA repair protein RecN [Actinomarinicola tropica]QGG95222.1 DNA repair protein RecN [Actinomarinicola tropica]